MKQLFIYMHRSILSRTDSDLKDDFISAMFLQKLYPILKVIPQSKNITFSFFVTKEQNHLLLL